MIKTMNNLEEVAFRIMRTDLDFWIDVETLKEDEFKMIDTSGVCSNAFTYVDSEISDGIQYDGVLYGNEKRLYFVKGYACYLLRLRETFDGEEGFELFLKSEGTFIPQNFINFNHIHVFMEVFGI